MAQIKKKFIAPNAIDGSKIQLQNNEAVRVKDSSGNDVELFKLDSSNIFQFLSLPRLSSDPSDGSDSVRKSYVDAELLAEAGLRIAADAAEQAAREAAVADLQSQLDALEDTSSALVAAEQAAREAADTALQGAIDTEKGRIDAILLASDADKDSFAEIVNLINSVDTENDSAFASYVLSNDAALAQEVSDRQAADSAEQSAREAADSAEAAARQAADSQLSSDLAAETSARQAADSAEQAAREAADTTLQNNLDAETAARTAADSAEQSAREAADSDLQDAIDAEVARATAAEAAEQSAREAADADLQDQIDTEKGRIDAILLASDADKDSFAEIVNLINSVDTENDSAFASYVLSNDAALAQEVSDRQAADAAEQAARESADAALQSALDQEVADREAAVSAEQAIREAQTPQYFKHATYFTAQDISNGYMSLFHKIIPDSEVVAVDRLMVHTGVADDYIIDNNGPVTNIVFRETYRNSEEGPSEGDLFVCTYAYRNGDQPVDSLGLAYDPAPVVGSTSTTLYVSTFTASGGYTNSTGGTVYLVEISGDPNDTSTWSVDLNNALMSQPYGPLTAGEMASTPFGGAPVFLSWSASLVPGQLYTFMVVDNSGVESEIPEASFMA